MRQHTATHAMYNSSVQKKLQFFYLQFYKDQTKFAALRQNKQGLHSDKLYIEYTTNLGKF